MRKVRVRTIRGFCRENLEPTELLRNNPRIAHANLGSARNLLGSRSKTSAICGNKPTIDRARKAAFCSENLGSARTQSSGIAQPNLGHPRQHATKPRSSAATNTRSIAHAKQLGHPRQRSHDRSYTQSSSAIRGKEATIDRARKAARPSAATNPRCRGWPSCFACAIDRGFVDADDRGLVARS